MTKPAHFRRLPDVIPCACCQWCEAYLAKLPPSSEAKSVVLNSHVNFLCARHNFQLPKDEIEVSTCDNAEYPDPSQRD